MKKVGIITHSFPTIDVPSASIFVQKEVQLLSNYYSIEVLVPQVFGKKKNDWFNTNVSFIDIGVPISTFNYFSMPRRKLPGFTKRFLTISAKKFIHESDIDLYHVHFLYPSGLLIPFLKKAGKKVILTLHGGDWYTNQNKMMSKNVLDACGYADKIITVGKDLHKSVIKKFPAYKDKVYHVSHGINTDLFSTTSYSEKNLLKEKLHWNPNRINLLCVANLYPVKGIDVLINAISKSLRKEDIILHLVSATGEPKYKENIINLITELDMTPYVHFYDSMSPEKLVALYKAADLFVLPSRSEAFGLALAEAVSCGLPSLATYSGGPEEIITDKSGKLVVPNNIQEMVKGLDFLLKNISSFDSMGMHEYIKEKFSLDSKSSTLKSIYESLF